MTKDEKIRLANELKGNSGWSFFASEMERLIEVANGELRGAYSRNSEHHGAFVAGFKLGLETALNFPERAIKINQGLLEKMKREIEEVLS